MSHDWQENVFSPWSCSSKFIESSMFGSVCDFVFASLWTHFLWLIRVRMCKKVSPQESQSNDFFNFFPLWTTGSSSTDSLVVTSSIVESWLICCDFSSTCSTLSLCRCFSNHFWIDNSDRPDNCETFDRTSELQYLLKA